MAIQLIDQIKKFNRYTASEYDQRDALKTEVDQSGIIH